MLQSSIDGSTSIVFQDAPGRASDFKRHSSALGCQLWSTRRRNAFAAQQKSAVQRADCGMRTAKDSRGLRWSKGEEKGRAKPPGMATGHRYRYGHGYRDGCPYRHYSGLVGTGLGEFGGASRFGTDLRRRLLQAIDKRKKVQPGNRRYRYLASSAAAAPCKPENNRTLKLPSFMVNAAFLPS